MNTSNSGKRHSIPNVFKPTDESSEPFDTQKETTELTLPLNKQLLKKIQ
jgi:hypothetical protein